MFATVMRLVLHMCILTSCSSVICVLMALGKFMFVKVMSCRGCFWCFSFLCEFCFLYCDGVWLGAVYEIF